MSETNPFLRDAIMAVVDNQLRQNDPPETREALQRLVSEGHTEGDAKRLIGTAVVAEIFDVLKLQHEFDRDRVVAALSRLPELPSEDEQ